MSGQLLPASLASSFAWVRIIEPSLVALCAVAVLTSACRRGGLDLHPVSGQVTCDGVPLAAGQIIFRAPTGDTRGFRSLIKDGSYRVRCFSGSMTVAIHGIRDIPGSFTRDEEGNLIQDREQFLPASFNEKSTLSAKIPRGGTNRLDFTLTLQERGVPEDVHLQSTKKRP